MATSADSKGSVSTPLERKRARPKDFYFLLCDENASVLKESDAEFKRLITDFSRIARNRRR